MKATYTNKDTFVIPIKIGDIIQEGGKVWGIHKFINILYFIY